MTAKITITNLSDVIAGLDAKEDQINLAVQYAIAMVGARVESQAEKNASGRPGPNVRTGNLRRSITSSKVNVGLNGLYSVDVSATMVYARAVELGHPRWKPGVKYPYLGPAANSLQADGTLSRIFTLAMASKLRG